MFKSLISKVILTSFVASSAFTAGFIVNRISKNTDIINKFKKALIKKNRSASSE